MCLYVCPSTMTLMTSGGVSTLIESVLARDRSSSLSVGACGVDCIPDIFRGVNFHYGHYGLLDSPRPSITVPSRNRLNVFSRPHPPVQIPEDRRLMARRSPVHFGGTGTSGSLSVTGHPLRLQGRKFLTISRPVVSLTIFRRLMPLGFLLLISAETPTWVSGALISRGPRG